MKKRILQIMVLLLTLMGSLRLYYRKQIGNVIDEYGGIPVYFNSIPFTTQGENMAPDGYEFGKKFENIEFIKRFYYKEYGRKIPVETVAELYNPKLNSGEKNIAINLYQYSDDSIPEIGDIILSKTPFGEYAGIVTKVTDDSVEIVRQNFWKETRKRFKIISENGNLKVDGITGRLSVH